MKRSEFILLPIPSEAIEEAGIDAFTPIQTYVLDGKIIVEPIDSEDYEEEFEYEYDDEPPFGGPCSDCFKKLFL